MEAKDKDKIADLLFRRKYTELIVTEQLRLDQAIDYIEKAGIREVVEWIQKEGIWAQVPFKGKRKEETMWCLFPEEWQVKLKEWFKDSPELLEKWGIK